MVSRCNIYTRFIINNLLTLPSYSKDPNSVLIVLFSAVPHGVSARQRINCRPSRSSSHDMPPNLGCFRMYRILCCVPTSGDTPPPMVPSLCLVSDDKLLGDRVQVTLHWVQAPQLDHSQSSGSKEPKNEKEDEKITSCNAMRKHKINIIKLMFAYQSYLSPNHNQ